MFCKFAHIFLTSYNYWLNNFQLPHTTGLQLYFPIQKHDLKNDLLFNFSLNSSNCSTSFWLHFAYVLVSFIYPTWMRLHPSLQKFGRNFISNLKKHDLKNDLLFNFSLNSSNCSTSFWFHFAYVLISFTYSAWMRLHPSLQNFGGNFISNPKTRFDVYLRLTKA